MSLPLESQADYSDVAVLLPCYNEEITIAKVVADFRTHLPGAKIYVFDNNSNDRTSERARGAGATVVPSPKQGKGCVVRHMFDTVEATIYLMADGDDTYPAKSAPQLIQECRGGVDMVVGIRMESYDQSASRRFHKFGNHLVARLISLSFSTKVTDVLSGFRAFSRSFVKSVPLVSVGFTIETEMTMQAVAKGFSLREIPIEYGARPEGSFSKLRTYSDGTIVLATIVDIFKNYKPLTFFGGLCVLLGVISAIVGSAPVMDFFTTGVVVHVPRAVLAAALAIMAMLSLGIGLILDSTCKYHHETFTLWRRVLTQSK
ncbi:MAG: glycosyltransferase family 2 protein [Bacteriovoracia bacterium]